MLGLRTQTLSPRLSYYHLGSTAPSLGGVQKQEKKQKQCHYISTSQASTHTIHPTHTQQQQNNICENCNATAPTTSELTEFSMQNRRAKRANAVIHKATKVNANRSLEPTTTASIQPPTTTRGKTTELVTSAADWLIDSGATAHMTPYPDDFDGSLTPLRFCGGDLKRKHCESHA
jgi:hypothetical protein